MNLRRIATLLVKEMRIGATNFMVVFALVVPVVLSLVVNLVFGDLFSARPRLGFVDEGHSDFVKGMQALTHIDTRLYASPQALMEDVEQGIIQSGLLIPDGFDDALRNARQQTVRIYTWGETPYRDRLIADTAIANVTATVAGLPNNVSVHIIQLGSGSASNLGEQMLPMLLLMTILLGGVMVTAISVIMEKEHSTLSALAVTPAHLPEVLAAKALLGVLIGTTTGLVTLLINNALAAQPWLLILIIVMASLVASVLGLLLGVLLKDMQVLLAALKAGGIILFAPGILEMVPQVPGWIARIFPTYYLIHPLMAVAQRGAGLSQVLPDLAVMLAFFGGLLFFLMRLVSGQARRNTLMG